MYMRIETRAFKFLFKELHPGLKEPIFAEKQDLIESIMNVQSASKNSAHCLARIILFSDKKRPHKKYVLVVRLAIERWLRTANIEEWEISPIVLRFEELFSDQAWGKKLLSDIGFSNASASLLARHAHVFQDYLTAVEALNRADLALAKAGLHVSPKVVEGHLMDRLSLKTLKQAVTLLAAEYN